MAYNGNTTPWHIIATLRHDIIMALAALVRLHDVHSKSQPVKYLGHLNLSSVLSKISYDPPIPIKLRLIINLKINIFDPVSRFVVAHEHLRCH